MPLLFQPGSEWSYSVATDVLGRIVEVVSGQRLDEFFASRIFGPLGMTDSAFFAGPADVARLAALYTRNPENGTAMRMDAMGNAALREPVYLSGGGGLVSSAADYNRFTQMLLHRPGSPAGELDGTRLLSPRTVAYMASNHLPGGADLETFGRPLYAETVFAGVGFGLGLRRRNRPAGDQVARLGRGVQLGRRSVDNLLGRSRRAGDGHVLHPAAALQRLPDQAAAAADGVPGPGGLAVRLRWRPRASGSRRVVAR